MPSNIYIPRLAILQRLQFSNVKIIDKMAAERRLVGLQAGGLESERGSAIG